ncbi:MAG: glycosyltransferase family 39 protein [Smithella sp.]
MGKKKKGRPDIKALSPKSLTDHGPIRQKRAVEGHWDDNFAIKYCGYAFLLAIVVLAVFLRVYDISAKDVWCDEANSVIIAELNPSGIITRMSHDASPPLYYLLLHSWMYAFGETELALRSLSVLFGILLIIAVYFTGKRIFSEKVGLSAALIASVAPIHIMYSQQIRMYTLLPLMSLMSMYYLLRFIQEKKISFLAGYGIFTILSLFTHNYGIFLLPAQALLVLLFVRQRQMILWWFFSVVCICAVYAIWIPSLSGQISAVPKTGWRDYFWNLYGFGGSLFMSAASFSPGGPLPPYVPLNSMRWMPVLPVVIMLLLLIASLIPLFNKKYDQWKTGVGWLAVYCFIPLISAGIVSYLHSNIYLPGRTDQLVFPAFCLLAAVGIQQFRPVFLRYAAVTLIMVCSLLTLYDYYRIDLQQGNKMIAQTIKERLAPGDTILCTSLTRGFLEYYLREEKPRPHFYSYPPAKGRSTGGEDVAGLLKNPWKLDEQTKLLFSEVKSHSSSGRCFIVYVPNEVNKFLDVTFITNVPAGQITNMGRFKQSLFQLPVYIILVHF